MTESTRESLHEALSASIDGEAEELELRRVLNAMEKDPELQAKWERLHLIGSVVRGESTRPAVAEGGQSESGGPVGAPGGARWLGPAAGIGIAAAVMIAVALNLAEDPQSLGGEPSIAALDAPTELAAMPSEEDIRRAHAYLMRHAQHTSTLNRPGMPFVKVLAVQNEDEEAQ